MVTLTEDMESGVDALAELAELAQPLGPPDLSRNFDVYTRRVLEMQLPVSS